MIDFTLRMIKYLPVIVGSQAHKADYFVISAAIDRASRTWFFKRGPGLNIQIIIRLFQKFTTIFPYIQAISSYKDYKDDKDYKV